MLHFLFFIALIDVSEKKGLLVSFALSSIFGVFPSFSSYLSLFQKSVISGGENRHYIFFFFFFHQNQRFTTFTNFSGEYYVNISLP